MYFVCLFNLYVRHFVAVNGILCLFNLYVRHFVAVNGILCLFNLYVRHFVAVNGFLCLFNSYVRPFFAVKIIPYLQDLNLESHLSSCMYVSLLTVISQLQKIIHFKYKYN